MEKQIQEGYLKKQIIHNSNCFLCTLVVFRHSYVQLQTARSQRYQLYVLHYNTASNAHFMICHLLYCIISWYQLLWKNCFYLLLNLWVLCGNELCICIQSSSSSPCCITWYTKGYAADSSTYSYTQILLSTFSLCASFSIVCFFTNDNICVYLHLQNIKLVTLYLCNKDWT